MIPEKIASNRLEKDREKKSTVCQDSSVERFLRIDPMVSGSSPPSAKLSLRMRTVVSSL